MESSKIRESKTRRTQISWNWPRHSTANASRFGGFGTFGRSNEFHCGRVRDVPSVTENPWLPAVQACCIVFRPHLCLFMRQQREIIVAPEYRNKVASILIHKPEMRHKRNRVVRILHRYHDHGRLPVIFVAGPLHRDCRLRQTLQPRQIRKRQDTVYTPQAEFADLTGLESLPKTAVSVERTGDENHGKTAVVVVTVKNPNDSVAFMTHLRLVNKDGSDLVPVFWSDNYFTLLPHEETQVWAEYDTAGLNGWKPGILCDGWNVTNAATVKFVRTPESAKPAKP